MKAAQQAEEWLPKVAAAKLAGVSIRQLERREAQGYVEKLVKPRGPLDRTAPVFYRRADLLALKAGTPNVHARPETAKSDAAVVAVSNDPAAAGRSSTALALRNDSRVDPFVGLAAHLARLAVAFPSAPTKPWLTLPEAVEYSGLPAGWLLQQARGGLVRAVNVGTGKREFWRFNREALGK